LLLTIKFIILLKLRNSAFHLSFLFSRWFHFIIPPFHFTKGTIVLPSILASRLPCTFLHHPITPRHVIFWFTNSVTPCAEYHLIISKSTQRQSYIITHTHTKQPKKKTPSFILSLILSLSKKYSEEEEGTVLVWGKFHGLRLKLRKPHKTHFRFVSFLIFCISIFTT
jgi:hypothetical protein